MLKLNFHIISKEGILIYTSIMMKESPRKILSYRIRSLRRAKGWTQADLADKINRSVEMVCHLECGTAATKLSTLQDIADALDVAFYELFLPADEPSLYQSFSPELVELIEELQEQDDAVISALLTLFRSRRTEG